MAASGSDAEAPGRLPPPPHHQEGSAQVYTTHTLMLNAHLLSRPTPTLHIQTQGEHMITVIHTSADTHANVCVCVLSDFYESSAVMLEEEGAVIVGLLVGLNVIDANLCVKGEDLDTQVRRERQSTRTGDT